MNYNRTLHRLMSYSTRSRPETGQLKLPRAPHVSGRRTVQNTTNRAPSRRTLLHCRGIETQTRYRLRRPARRPRSWPVLLSVLAVGHCAAHWHCIATASDSMSASHGPAGKAIRARSHESARANGSALPVEFSGGKHPPESLESARTQSTKVRARRRRADGSRRMCGPQATTSGDDAWPAAICIARAHARLPLRTEHRKLL